ncbi:unnamed protein product [Medioppia subpectinata]|uniref:Uncharacterized protein n=1 Tax=Medioppia subpectinata TaxID=1979941 RepID=A0A7R9LI25_9ACAR|nr:unnamed protein product [Medioppia subpectinata]CAG2119013.1 unnamed protein product [Medioppia subpectinata]
MALRSFRAELWAKNCPQLTSLSLELMNHIQMASQPVLLNIESLISECFRFLPKCVICENDELATLPEPIDLGSLESLKAMKQLTSMKIVYKNLNNNCLQDIHEYCPQLNRLVLKTQQKLSNKALNSLSKLKVIKVVEIYSTPYDMTDISDTGICDLIDNCPDLRVLTLKCGTTVTDTTFDALKSRVNRWPHRLFVFGYCWQRTEGQSSQLGQESDHLSKAEIIWPQLQSLPNNLIIYNREYFTGRCGTMSQFEQNRYYDQFTTNKWRDENDQGELKM